MVGLDDRPVVLDHRPQRVVEREADERALLLGESFVKPCHGGFREIGSRRPNLGWSIKSNGLRGPSDEGNRRRQDPRAKVLTNSRRENAEQHSNSWIF